MNTTLQEILAVLGLFFSKNPTVAEIEALLPQILNAIAGAKAGTAFSVTFPLSVDAKPGAATFSWSPTA
ncbi:MAG: hypothetical protein WCE44_02690 [Candidatus Velthaea sp.]